jgi:hypothetical protein
MLHREWVTISRARRSVVTSTDTNSPESQPRRPFLVWIVFLFYIYVGISLPIDYWRGYVVLANGYHIRLPASNAERAIRGTVIFLAFVAAVELFRLRSAAVVLLTAGWIARAMLTTYDVAQSSRGRHFIATGATGVVAFAVYSGLLAYAVHLKRRGVLRPGV